MEKHKPYTTVNKETGKTEDPNYVDFRQSTFEGNLKYVFGTSSMFHALLPSIRDQGHNGINWENYVDLKKRG